MTGTPFTSSRSEDALEQLYRLLVFLKHPRLLDTADHASTEPIDLATWRRTVVAPCLAQDATAWLKIEELLQSVLVRHTKVV